VHRSIGQIKHQLDATLCRFYFCRVTLSDSAEIKTCTVLHQVGVLFDLGKKVFSFKFYLIFFFFFVNRAHSECHRRTAALRLNVLHPPLHPPGHFRHSYFCCQVPPCPRRERSQQRKVELSGRESSGNFAEMTTSTPFRDLLRAANLRHGTDSFISPPKEGVLRIFSP